MVPANKGRKYPPEPLTAEEVRQRLKIAGPRATTC